eukprot:TRINITY_DN2324_c1_g2_i2.p1 TRINITY_DN2324_c1_g2~~TRINITY_DN2324_c1_g2_i2.p1  ORF type:complete len:344 (+),score=124.45 TRINITY_DN2324_c1_g2_i2:1176-2207(+)
MDKFIQRTKRKVEDEVKTEGGDEKKAKLQQEKVDPDAKNTLEWLTIPISTLKSNQEYENYFTMLSEVLLNHFILRANGVPLRILEIEFYFTNNNPKEDSSSPLIHHDPFTHCDTIQKQTAVWYFHRTAGAYRGGTYKGLDIAIGQGDEHIGGILIRSIQSLNDGKIVCGPCKSVDHILELCKVDGIRELVDEKMGGVISCLPPNSQFLPDGTKGNPILYLERGDSFDKKTVYRSARVGLHMTKSLNKEPAELQKEFVFKHYRYFCEPKMIFKGQFYMVAAFANKGMSKGDIGKILNTKAATIEKYIQLVEQGKKMDSSKFVGTKMSDDEVCKAYGSLHSFLTW